MYSPVATVKARCGGFEGGLLGDVVTAFLGGVPSAWVRPCRRIGG